MKQEKILVKGGNKMEVGTKIAYGITALATIGALTMGRLAYDSHKQANQLESQITQTQKKLVESERVSLALYYELINKGQRPEWEMWGDSFTGGGYRQPFGDSLTGEQGYLYLDESKITQIVKAEKPGWMF